MCVKAYYGWECGHPDLSATELPIEPCGLPKRQPHEPFCSPLIRELVPRKVPDYAEDEEDSTAALVNQQTDVCAACYEILIEMKEQWNAKRTVLRYEGKATEQDLDNIYTRLHEHKISVFEKGHESGPDHTVHLEYEAGQNAILRETDRLLGELCDAKNHFRDNINIIKSKGRLSDKTIHDYLRMYSRAERRRTALDMEQIRWFRTTVDQYVQGLTLRHMSLEAWSPPQKAIAAHESSGVDPESGVAELPAEIEPKSEAGPSDT